MSKGAVYLSGVCERDIDLLLCEEFYASPQLVSWFCQGLGFRNVRLLSVTQSESDETGETDVLLRIKTRAGKTILIFIENKIYAGFQPNQQPRYLARAKATLRREGANAYRTCLVAPQYYLDRIKGTGGFDRAISYEDILTRLNHSPAPGKRGKFKEALFRCALEKAKGKWQLREDPQATELWRGYWEYAQAHVGVLQMRRPLKKPRGSTFVYFAPLGLPKAVRLVHKMAHGNADLQLAGCVAKEALVEEKLVPRLTPSMSVVRTNKSLAIRIAVPVLSVHTKSADQIDAIRAGLAACLTLFDWYRQNRQVVVDVLKA